MPNLAYAKALDLSDTRFIFNQNYRILGTQDINQIENSEIVIITAGIPRKPGMKREELFQKNSQVVKDICQKIKRLCPKSTVIVVTNPLDAMTYLVIKETSLPAQRVLGMGLTLDRSRLANLIAEKMNVDITEVEPCVIGSHGEEMLPLSRYTKIKGQSLEKYLKPQEINDLFQRTVKRGAEILSLSNCGSAYFAPSAAISEITKVIARDEKRILPVSVYLNGEYGLSDLCIGLPCSLGKEGVEKIIDLELNEEEKAALLKSAESIKRQISGISGRYQDKAKV
jgi:malate dehydrogenase